MSESASNIIMTCPEHSARPDPRLHGYDPFYYVSKYVKRAFKARDGGTEHMWVKIIAVVADEQGTDLLGVVNNDPVLDVGVQCGDTVRMQVTEIEDIFQA